MREVDEVVERVLGMPGLMISASKSGYGDQHPGHVAIFNANVCVASGKIWFGDLDLTLDEPRIRELADTLGERVFVLYEGHGRFEHESEPLLDQAIYSVTPGEEPAFDRRIFIRAADGTLRWPAPEELPVFTAPPGNWDGSKRPRLLRFWQLSVFRVGAASANHSSRIIYVGERGGSSPRLVLRAIRVRDPGPELMFEISWYPSRRPYRSTPLPDFSRSKAIGRVRVSLRVMHWPGFAYEVRIVVARA